MNFTPASKNILTTAVPSQSAHTEIFHSCWCKHVPCMSGLHGTKADFYATVLSKNLPTKAKVLAFFKQHGTATMQAFAAKNQRKLEEWISDAIEWNNLLNRFSGRQCVCSPVPGATVSHHRFGVCLLAFTFQGVCKLRHNVVMRILFK